ncbi:MAG: hypothetical protein BWY55_00927 [archaeon ADurb.Bin336]|nr:MAG: hypothetical protein BWY55_00927 [archaeon ADurb.Bin336]
MNKKVCTKCNKNKCLTEFTKNKNYKDGLNYHCKACIKEYNENFKLKNPNYQKDYFKEYYKKNKPKYQETNKKHYEAGTTSIQRDKEKWAKYTDEWHRQDAKKLGKTYVKGLLKRKGLTNQDLIEMPSLIDVQKELVETKRMMKKEKNSNIAKIDIELELGSVFQTIKETQKKTNLNLPQEKDNIALTINNTGKALRALIEIKKVQK